MGFTGTEVTVWLLNRTWKVVVKEVSNGNIKSSEIDTSSNFFLFTRGPVYAGHTTPTLSFRPKSSEVIDDQVMKG